MLLLLCLVQLHSAIPDVDPLGPIVSVVRGRPMSAIVAPGRVEARRIDFDPGAIPNRPGTAGWIWLSMDGFPGPAPVAARFRKEIDLPAKPLTAQTWFTADAHARIYVNGRLVARGPDDGGQDYPGTQTGKWFVNYRDLTSFFHKGRNVVAAEVFTARAMEGRYNTTGRGGFLFEATFHLPDGSTRSLPSDDTWRGARASEWRFARWETSGEQLQFDAAAEPVGWRSPGFVDSDWPSCEAVPANWPPFETSQIPPRLEATYPWMEIQRPTHGVIAHGRQITLKSWSPSTVALDFSRTSRGEESALSCDTRQGTVRQRWHQWPRWF